MLVITLCIFLAYLAGVMVTFRIFHIRRMTEYLRWKNDSPNEVKYYGSDPWNQIHKQRQHVTFWQYMCYVNPDWSRLASLLWPFIGPYVVVKKFCTPEVKIPDVTTLKNIEKELDRL